MKSKAPLLLMEQMIMLLVFALAAALCLQAFVKSDAISQRSERRDRALQAAQNAAEVVRQTRGDLEQAAALLDAASWDEGTLMVDYDRDWNIAQDTMRYTLGVHRIETDVPGLGKAGIWVRDEADETGESVLLRIEVCWQEVSAHAG